MSRKILCLEIGYDAVAAVLLKNGVRGSVIESHTRIPFRHEQENGLMEALAAIQEKMDTNGSVCAVGLPPGLASFRNIRVPFRETRKIRQVLPYELEPALPRSVEDLVIEFIEVARFSDQTHVLAVSIEKENLQFYLEKLADSKLDPELVTISVYPLAAHLHQAVDDLPHGAIVIDAGPDHTTVAGIISGKIGFVRTIITPLGSGNTRMEGLSRQIKQTLSAFQDTSGIEFYPELALITGPAWENSKNEALVSESLGIPFRSINIVQHSKISLNNPLMPWQARQMDNALALGFLEMRGTKEMNFRKGPFAAHKKILEYRRDIITTAVILCAVLMIGFTGTWLDTRLLGRKLDGLDRQISEVFKDTFPETRRIVDPLHQMQTKLQAARKTDFASLEIRREHRVVDLLNRISILVPEDVDMEFTQLVYGPERILISGKTDAFNSVEDVKGRIEQIEIFKSVKISLVNVERGGSGVRFKLAIEL